MTRFFITTSLLFLINLVYLPVAVFSHSGRTDSSGGHNCRVGACAGTYHYHNGGSSYTPPSRTYTYTPPCLKPTIGNSGNFNVSTKSCKQSVTFDWEDGLRDEFYSVGISKYAGADPGPLSDTNVSKYTFQDVSPGKWYVNIKAGNSCGWTTVYYWEVEVPHPEVTAFIREEVISEEERELHFSTYCADKVKIEPEIGWLTASQIEKGEVLVRPTEKTAYILTAQNNQNTRTARVVVEHPLPTATPTPSPSETSKNSVVENKSGNESGLFKRFFRGLLSGLW